MPKAGFFSLPRRVRKEDWKKTFQTLVSLPIQSSQYAKMSFMVIQDTLTSLLSYSNYSSPSFHSYHYTLQFSCSKHSEFIKIINLIMSSFSSLNSSQGFPSIIQFKSFFCLTRPYMAWLLPISQTYLLLLYTHLLPLQPHCPFFYFSNTMLLLSLSVCTVMSIDWKHSFMSLALFVSKWLFLAATLVSLLLCPCPITDHHIIILF